MRKFLEVHWEHVERNGDLVARVEITSGQNGELHLPQTFFSDLTGPSGNEAVTEILREVCELIHGL